MISRKTKQWLLVLFGIVLLSSILAWRSFEPRYEGRRLSAWVEDLPIDRPWGEENDPEILEQQQKATEAIRQIGKDALPLAIKLCRTKDSALKQKLMEWDQRYPLFGFHLAPAWEKHQKGIRIFRFLGDDAKIALPELTELLQHEETANNAQVVLSRLQPEGLLALRNALTHSNSAVRCAATFAFNHPWTHEYALTFFPELLRQLGDSNFTVRLAAVHVMTNLSDKVEIIVPALIRCLNDKDQLVHREATLALAKINGDAKVVVPALVDYLEQETNSVLLFPVLSTLEHYGTNATSAVPVLVKIIESHPKELRAFLALRKIDPATAATLLQKFDFLRTNTVLNKPPD